MVAFFILIASIASGVLLSRFMSKRGTGKLKRRMAGIGCGVLAFIVLAIVLRPAAGDGAMAPTKDAPAPATVASAAPKCMEPPAGTVASNDQAPDGTPWCDGKWHDTPLASAPSSEPPVIRVTARELFNAYDENEVATDAKLHGKIVVVAGQVDAIDKDYMGSAVVQLRTRNEFMPASMTLKRSEIDKAGQLKRGETVVVRCEKMARIMGSPAGHSCSLQLADR